MTGRTSPATALCAAAPAFAAETLDWATIGRIRDEGFRRSQVMETAAQLTDVHGPRLSGSPQYKEAAEWARQQLQTWGLDGRAPRALPVRPRLELRARLGARRGSRDVPAGRDPEGLDRGHERRRCAAR